MNVGGIIRRQGKIVKPIDFNKLAKTVDVLRKLKYDQKYFNVLRTGAGQLLTFNKQAVDDLSPFTYHFQVEANVASNTVDIHGGRWIRYYDGYEAGGDGNLKITKLSTTDGSTSSGEYEHIYTLAGLTNNASNYIVVKLDDPFDPTTLTPEVTTTYPTSNLFDRTRKVIACANVDSVGVVVDIEPYVDGGDITDEMTYANDDCSLDRNGSDQNQIHQFSNAAATTTIADTDEMVIKDADTGCVNRVLWSNCKSDVVDDILDNPDFCTAVEACIEDGGWICDWLNDNCSWTAVDHGELLGLEDDDHNGGHSGGAGNYPYVSGHVDAGSRLGNAFDATAFIADENGNASIYPHGRYLQAAGIDTLSWSGWYLKNGVGNITLNWDTCELANSTWTALGDFVVNSDLDVLGNANVGGECHVVDFVSSSKFQISDSPVFNYWTDDNFIVNPTATIQLLAGTSVQVGLPMNSQINIENNSIDLYPSGTGMLYIDGTQCKSMTGYYVIDSEGAIHEVEFTKGLLTTG